MGLKYESENLGNSVRRGIRSTEKVDITKDNLKVRFTLMFETKPGSGLSIPPQMFEQMVTKMMDDILGPTFVGLIGFDGGAQMGLESVPADDVYEPGWLKKEKAAETEALHAEAEAILRGDEESGESHNKGGSEGGPVGGDNAPKS